jgi:hypothetical protein
VSRDTDSRSGKIFLTPNHNQQAGAMILDGRGRLVWYRPSPRPVYNLQRQRYLGRPVLSWWEGYWLLSGRDFIVDRSYRTVAVVRAQEGYQADFHEFQVTPQGTALLDTYSPVRVDLSGVGGSSTGTVLDCIIQEVDIRTGRLLWEWHSLGHVPLSASYTPVPSGSGAFDYFHLNSIQRLPGGNLLISAKGTWSLYEIDRRTGNVRWTIGGKHPSFSMGPGTNFEWQHDPRLKPDGTLTVFDDAGAPQEEPQSSAKLLRVNTARMKVTLIHRYTHSPRLLAGLAGSVQTLPNQNVFVGWGSAPVFSEYTPDGRLVLDGRFPYGVWSYRAYRFQWVGQPVTRPALATAATSDGGTAFYASWNGATRVAYWRVLAGSGPDSLRPAGQVARRTGFETMIKRAARRRCWAVQALDARRMVLATSRVQRVPARG